MRSRFVHRISELLGTQSHDADDQMDPSLEADAEARRALVRSLGILGATAAIQLAVVAFSGSVALLGDGLQNVADALTAVPLLLVCGLASRAPTKRYTYGYGRAEDLAGLFVIAMVACSQRWPPSRRSTGDPLPAFSTTNLHPGATGSVGATLEVASAASPARR